MDLLDSLILVFAKFIQYGLGILWTDAFHLLETVWKDVIHIDIMHIELWLLSSRLLNLPNAELRGAGCTEISVHLLSEIIHFLAIGQDRNNVEILDVLAKTL